MNRRSLRATSLAIALFVVGCASNAPVIDYDRDADFSSYRSYAFISDHPMLRSGASPMVSPLLEARLMRVTDETLESRGYRKLDDPESADFAVGFTVGTREKLDVDSYPETYRPYYGGWGWGASYHRGYGGAGVGMSTGSRVDVSQYTEGTLAVDIYDVREHKPVWHGAATRRITDKMRRNPDEAVNEIIGEILEDFPPMR